MRVFVTLRGLMLTLAILFLPGVSFADPLFTTLWNTHTNYGDPVPNSYLEDYYIQYGTGLVAFNDWANADTKLAWNIVDNLDGTYTYSYRWSSSAKALSHIIIELTDGTTLFGDPTPAPAEWEIDTYDTGDPGKSNPGLPGTIYGVKIVPSGSPLDYTTTFISTNFPVWGNIYAIDGKNPNDPTKNHYAYNTGFEYPLRGVFVPRPDGNGDLPPIPEPGTVLLLGSGLAVLALKLRRNRKA